MSSGGDDVTVRQCEPGEVTCLMEIAKEQNWDFTMYDYRSYMRLDPTFLLVAIDNSTREPIGFAGLSLNGPDLYYFGNFIVREDRRGQGVGRKLWKAMLAKAGDKSIALDGAPEMVGWYKKNGFKFESFLVKMCDIELNQEMKISVDKKFTVKLLSEEDWPSLMEYDRKVYVNFDREKILRAWFTDEVVKVYIARKEGIVVGYGSIHKQTEISYALRNVFADNECVLEEILRSMFEDLSVGTNIRFWIIEDKPLPKYLKTAGSSLDTGRRLCTKDIIEVNTEKMWLCTAHIV